MTNRILRNMKLLVIVLVFFGCNILLAQEVKVKDVAYIVKEGVITKEGVDITSTLKQEQKDEILALAKSKKLQELANAENAKHLKEAEKREKKLLKGRKKSVKALKQQEKLQANFKSADKKYTKTLVKYERLKEKGKLSPVDDSKMLEKIDKLKEKLEKAKKKLK